MSNPTTEEKMTLLRIRPLVGGPWCVCEPDEIVDLIDGSEETYQVEVIRMTETEREALGDFDGW